MININNMLTQLNAKMAADIADSYNVPELVKRVEAYQKLNVDAGTVPEYSSSNELPDLDSAIIGQIVYVKQKPESRGDYSNDIKDSAGTFFFGKKVDGTTIGWQKIPLLVGDSDYADIAASTYSFQGTVSGYVQGGYSPTRDVIDKFAFATDGNATDVGDLTQARYGVFGGKSSTHGYTGGGDGYNIIDKFPFAADENATDVGDITVAAGYRTGHSSGENGYSTGGEPYSNIIEKYPFSIDANSVDTGGDLVNNPEAANGHSSSTHGYSSGGLDGGLAVVNVIQKFPFSSDDNATDVADLFLKIYRASSTSSTTHGYTAGGGTTSSNNTIQKFSMVSDANGTDVGNLATAVRFKTETDPSSTTHGYATGGYPPNKNTIDKFPFSSDGDATDVGDLTVARGAAAGTQV